LRGLIEKLMLDVMYDIPSDTDVSGITITRAVALGETKPLVRRKTNQAAA
jgi:ATP-dependent Clp protease ATP-binding subunit ClpX